LVKARQMLEEHELKLTEVKHASEAKLKEFTDHQSKQVLVLEASEKEIKLLKDEVKTLKVMAFLTCHISLSQ